MSYIRKTASEVREKGEKAREGAVLILLYQKAEVWNTVLIQRPVYEGTHSGQIAFPGGKRDEEDVDLTFTALREMEEEVGLSPKEIEVIGHLTEVYIPPSNFLVQPVVGYFIGEPSFTPEEREVDEILETPLAWFLDLKLKRKKKIYIPHYDVHIEAPYYDVHGKILWGATAMMISELTELIKGKQLD